MNYIILGFCFTLMAHCAAAAPAAKPLGVTVYVSPLGDDAHAGTPEQPLQTFTRARDLLRKASDAAPKKMIVRGGEYYDVALELGPEDSGLVIQAAQGETPVLYGGRLVTGWQQDGEHPGENPGENLYAAQLPEVQGGAWDFRMLQVNGRFCTRARLPMGGHFRHLSRFDVPWLSTSQGEGTIDIWALPSQAVSLSGVERSLTFSLEPGQRLEQRFNVSAASQDELQLGARIRNDPNTGTMTQFFVPRDVKIPRLAAATLEEISALLANQSPARWQYLGNTVCELRMGVAGDQLAVSADIYNNAITPELAVWEQTNMDIYCSQPGSSTVRQVVIMPKSPQGDGQVLLFENGDEQARPEVQWQATPLANSGYQLTALIPLSVLHVDAERPFLFESAVVVPPDRDAAPVFVTLCGSTNAFMNNAKYHTIYVEPEHGESTKQ